MCLAILLQWTTSTLTQTHVVLLQVAANGSSKMNTPSEEKVSSGVKDGSSAGEEMTHGVARGGGRVRRATFADLDAILDINDNIYDGLDYMPAYFYIFMHSKNYAIYVYELDGQLVALCNYYFVPGTDDLVTIMSLRVRASFQGQGFGRPERNPITDQFRREHPQVTRYIIQTMLKPNIQAKMPKVKLLYHWNLLRNVLTDRVRLARLPSLPGSNPVTLSYTAGIDWLNRSNKLENFLSGYAEEYVVAGAKWIPVKVNATDLRQRFASNNILVSFAGKKENQGDDETIVIPAAGEEITSVDDREIVGYSSSDALHCKYGLSVVIHFYGDNKADFLSHVYSHVRHYVSVTQDDARMLCTIHFPLTMDLPSVRERLMENLGETYNLDSDHGVVEAVHYMAPL